MTVQHVEHIVSCGRSDHYAVDVPHTDEEAAPRRQVPVELTRTWINTRAARRRAALDRLQAAAFTDDTIADLLTVLGLENR
jgi:hypothetical protein